MQMLDFGGSMKKFAPVLIVIAGILWGCIGLFVRPLNEKGLSSMDVVALRAYVTLLAMSIFLLIYDRKLFKIKLKDIWCFLGTGICSILFFNFCYFSCINITSLAVAAILLYTAPAIVMILSFFLFKEKLKAKKIIALIMTFVGCVLVTGVVGQSVPLSGKGILVGLGAGLGYALYSIFSRYAIERGYQSFTITFYTFLFASIGSFFISDFSQVITVATKETGNLLLCLSFGIVCTVLPYLTYTLGLKYVENGKASIIASIEPVTATILGFFVFHEKLSIASIFGVFLVLAALILCNFKEK